MFDQVWGGLRWEDSPRMGWGPTLAQHRGVGGSPTMRWVPGDAGSWGWGLGKMMGGLEGDALRTHPSIRAPIRAPHRLWQGN